MIKSIYVKDFALIDELELHPGEGLNIITGQTGAGKSILVGALNMILGERADTEVIRAGASKAISEALIELKGVNPVLNKLLDEVEIEYTDTLILRREIKNTGSRAFINDTPVSITILKQVGDQLVDLHGQHDHQLLLREENHRIVLDANASVQQILSAYKTEFDRSSEILTALNTLKKQERELREKQELYRFQLKELEAAKLVSDEIMQLEAELNLLDNAEILDQKAGLISSVGGESDVNLTSILASLEHALQDLSKIESEFETYLQEFTAARITIQETILFAERYRTGIEFNPNRLEFLRSRKSDIRKLEKKYLKSLEELILYKDELEKNLNLAENFDLEINKLEKNLSVSRECLRKLAISLHESRLVAGTQLAAEIVDELKHLGIEHAQFQVKVDWLHDKNGWIQIDGQSVGCLESGADEIRFYISTNKGEYPKALSKTASGGEISRVMLALKSILAREQSLPVMIFDEIYTGISGIVAEKVGRTMRKLSNKCQIIAITHQPQIASQAHHHFNVAKTESDERTITTISKLNDDERIIEVAALMSGESVTAASLQSARELILSVDE